MPKIFTSKTQRTGKLGENIAERFLVKHGFSIIERNYTKKWGEIDIIAQKDKVLHFIEVKSISRELDYLSYDMNTWRAEDNMHPWKLKRISKTIQSYLFSKFNTKDIEFKVHLLVVYLDLKNKKAKVKVVNNIII